MDEKPLVVCHIITGLANGGAEGALYRLCAASQGSDLQNIVISMTGRGVYADQLEQTGIRIFCLDMPPGKLTWSGLIKLYRLLKTLRPTVVQTWMYHADLLGGLVARAAGIQALVWGIRNCDLEPGKSSKSSIMAAKLCALFSSFIPTKIVSCSTRAATVHQNLGYKADRFVIIGNGYSLDKLHPDPLLRQELRNKLKLPECTPVLGMVARYDPQKDHANLFEALAQVQIAGHNFVLLLIGNNMVPENTELMGNIVRHHLQDRVILLGPRHDIPAIMNVLDLHILSSSSEAFPNVLAEAMACGTPCVTTNTGDSSLIVGDTGWVAPPKNPAALASSIKDALRECQQEPDSWHQRQLACRQRVIDNYSINKMVTSFKKVWSEAIVATTRHAKEHT